MPMDASEPDSLLSAVHEFLRQCRCEAEILPCCTYWQTHARITAAEMQLLAALIDQSLCVDACARHLGRETESTGEFLDALVSVGLLDRCDELYSASPATALYCRAFIDGGLSPSDHLST